MIRIIYGLARSGKTARVMDEIRAIVRSAPVSPAARAILVVPEQYSHNAERQLLRVCGDSLSLSAEVLSFSRLTSRAFDELGVVSRQMSGGGRLLTLYRAIEQTRTRLSLYGEGKPRADFLQSLSDTISELKHSCVTPEDLDAAANAATGANGQLRAKLRDLALLMSATDAICGQNAVFDASDAATRLAGCIDATRLARARWFFDGFNDFTEPEARVIASLIRCGANLTFCLTADNLDDGDDAFGNVRLTARRIIRESALYNREVELVHTDGGVTLENPCPQVRLFAAPDAVTECEFAAATAVSLARQGFRWNEIAVMSRDVNMYGRICRRVMERYGVPVFLSGREDILHKPPVRFIIAALGVVQSGFRTEDVLGYLKSGMTGLSPGETDFLENYVIRWGVRAKQWVRAVAWTFGGDADDEYADALRREVISPLTALRSALRASRTCGEKLRALYAFLEDTGFAQTLDSRAEELRLGGETRLSDEYRQLWDITVAALDEMYGAASDYALDDRDFTKLLTLVLSQYDVGVIPVALDRVTVGEFTRSRRRDIRALIVLGATDELLPLTVEKPGVLSRAERGAAMLLGLPLTDTDETLTSRELNVIYSTFTMPSERLYVIYPETSRPSYVVALLKRSCGAEVARPAPEDYLACAPVPYREYASLLGCGAGSPDEPAPLSAQSVSQLFGAKLRLSATRAESWFSCKYAFFLDNGLRIKPRAEELLDAPSSGVFVHFALERTARLAAENGGFAAVDDEFVRQAVRNAAQEFTAEKLPGYDDYTERFRYLYSRLARDTERVALDLARESRGSAFVPTAFEQSFTVSVTNMLEVSGIIDRVDEWRFGGATHVRVSDYKTGGKSFSFSDLYYGLNMQMLVYLHAVGAMYGDKRVPSAALYIPARDEIVTLPRGTEKEKIAAKLADKLRRSGLVLRDEAVIEALERGEKRYLPVKTAKDGTYTGESLVTRGQITQLTRFALNRLRDVGDGIASGDVAPKPYYRSESDNACAYCEYRAACGFGASSGDKPRVLRRLDNDEFWRIVAEEVPE